MHRRHGVLSIVLIALGSVWVGQGTGLLKGGSFMVGDPRWAIAGGVAVVLGITLVAAARRDKSG